MQPAPSRMPTMKVPNGSCDTPKDHPRSSWNDTGNCHLSGLVIEDYRDEHLLLQIVGRRCRIKSSCRLSQVLRLVPG